MAAVSLAVVVRLQELGFASDAVAAEARLGIDEAAINQCDAEGFEPVSAVFAVLPESLMALDDDLLTSLHIRLMHTDSGDVWNDLFASDFAPVGVTPAVALPDQDNMNGAAQQENASAEGFTDDIFGDDFDDDIVGDLAVSGTTETEDIEAAFSVLAELSDTPAELDEISLRPADTHALADSERVFAEQEQVRIAQEERVRAEQEQVRIAEEERALAEQ
ncbi:MAG: hypothetical protein GY894_11550, partial [Planctomycetes bacterium]|nr:hypothetical protein [Planctomycetota bacterium]